jgi:hypothetical protein
MNSRLSKKGLKIRVLSETRDRKLVFVYNKDLLSKKIFSEAGLEILENYGYSGEKTCENYLCQLSQRIASTGGFPHEIGIFLGYPLNDVRGFIANKGQNFCLCGFWKVYDNAGAAERTFRNYSNCRRYLCTKVESGIDIFSALKI